LKSDLLVESDIMWWPSSVSGRTRIYQETYALHTRWFVLFTT